MSNLVLATVLAIALCCISVQEAASLPNAAYQFLDAHNRVRAQVGVPPLQWNDHLAKYARSRVLYQKVKYGCNLPIVTTFSNLKYGGIWALYTLTNMPVESPRTVVDYWASNSMYYNYTMNTCSSTAENCDAYKQVVSKYSTEVGCSRAHCGAGSMIQSLSLCFYNPDGIVKGQRPY